MVRNCGFVPELNSKPVAYRPAGFTQGVDCVVHRTGKMNGRLDNKVILELQRQMRIVGWTHGLRAVFLQV